MKLKQYITTTFLVMAVFATFGTYHAFAATPDGMGPWADSVVNFSQGLQKNGSPVASIRSDPTAALGVAEMTNADGTFVSLGFGGSLILKFDNGIKHGVLSVESTNLPYPTETASIELSADGTHWHHAGNVSRTGKVNQPKELDCAHYVKITDTSNPANFTDPTADGYDVDGVKAEGHACSTHDNDHGDNDDQNNGHDE